MKDRESEGQVEQQHSATDPQRVSERSEESARHHGPLAATNSARARFFAADTQAGPGPAIIAGLAVSDGAAGASNAAMARLLTGGVAQRSATAAMPGMSTVGPPPDFLESVRASGGGEALPPGFRAEAESSFGVGFADVRLHRDTAAAEAADGVSARAFTVGSDIYMGNGRYDPDSVDGRHLLAHELTHVAQQAGGPATVAMSSWLSMPGDASEQAADAAADRFAAGQPVGPVGRGPAVVAREPATYVTSTSADTASGAAGQAKAAPAGPGPVGFIPAYDGFQISSDATTARQQLRDIALTKGVETARRVAIDIRMRRAALGLDTLGLIPEPGTGMIAQAQAYDTVIAALQAEVKEWDDFEKEFSDKAAKKARDMLAISKQRVESERDRYGLTKGDEYTNTEFGAMRTEAYGMANNIFSKLLASAAAQLVDALVPLQEAVKKYETLAPYEGPATWEFDSGARPDDPDPVAWAAAKEELRRTSEAYMLLRNEKELRFPVLASFAGYERLDAFELKGTRKKLETVAKGSDSSATLVSSDVHDKLDHIQTVTEALDGKKLNIWAADNLVGLTKVEMGVSPGTLHDRVITQQVADDMSDRALRDMFIGVFAFALGLLAAPLTGGTSVAAAAGATAAATGSVALGGFLALEHLQEYQLGKAANATDFDKARVISSADPSLFWLAADIVGVILDAGAAMKAFKNLAEVAHRAARIRGRTAQGAIEALEHAASKHSPELGRTMREAAEKERARLGTDVGPDLPAAEAAGAAGPHSTAATVVVDEAALGARPGQVTQTQGPARPAASPTSDVDWDDPNVRRAMGLEIDPKTGKLQPTGSKLGKPGQLDTDPAERAYDPRNPAPGPYRGELGQVERGEYAAEAFFEVTKEPMYAVRVGDPGSWVDHLFPTLEEAQAYAKQLAASGEASIRNTSALPHHWPPDAAGVTAPGNKVDVARVLEVPAGTPTIRSTVGPQPESQLAPGRPTSYPGGGPQTQLPKYVFPRPPEGSAVSAAQRGQEIRISAPARTPAELARSLAATGAPVVAIARTVHAHWRSAEGDRINQISESELGDIYARNIQKYGDPVGPSIDWFRSRGKTWEEIIEIISKAGPGGIVAD
jgi:hypothetical protein